MTGFIERVLIPTDGSEGALAGARRAIVLASRLGASVHVLSVVDVMDDSAELDEAAISSLETRAESAGETIAELAREYDADLEVTTVTRRGTPFQSIREYAHRSEIDVIVMGTKGRSALERFLLGSVTENVLRTARVPVLAVPPNDDSPPIDEIAFDSLLLPTDGSDGAAIAADWGIALATRFDARVDALYAVDLGPFARESDPIVDESERRGEDAIEAIRERADDAGVEGSDSLVLGSPANAILAHAADREIDLIVMGTHGRTGIGQWFLGSVTENVVRGAEIPVFCVPVSAESP